MQDKAIEVIRHSLTAANAALDLLETIEANSDTVYPQQSVDVHGAPQGAQQVVEVCAAAGPSLSERLYTELADSKYNLRTVAELCGKFRITSTMLYEALDDMDEGYVTRTRISDSAPLVGLDTRN